ERRLELLHLDHPVLEEVHAAGVARAAVPLDRPAGGSGVRERHVALTTEPGGVGVLLAALRTRHTHGRLTRGFILPCNQRASMAATVKELLDSRVARFVDRRGGWDA